jgi:transcriptional regulator with XRE-family HTH domain
LTRPLIGESLPDTEAAEASIDQRIAQRLCGLRGERSWSVDELACRSGVGRASLSRLENAGVSPTTVVLGRLCPAFGLTMSRLLALVEDAFALLGAARGAGSVDGPGAGFRRRQVPPPSSALAGEVLECALDRGVRIAYGRPPRAGLEHHLVLVEGALRLTLAGRAFEPRPGDCLRYRLEGASVFETPSGSGARIRQPRRRAGCLAVDQARRPLGVEPQHPVAHDLQGHAAALRRLLPAPRQGAQRRRIVVGRRGSG